jgi:hypothetical protein|tara:strand:- start:331 stop:576 length:246 start_codon:yes stop_codon:yes gene_type:complete
VVQNLSRVFVVHGEDDIKFELDLAIFVWCYQVCFVSDVRHIFRDVREVRQGKSITFIRKADTLKGACQEKQISEDNENIEM